MCACSAVNSQALASMMSANKARVSIHRWDSGEQYCFPGPSSAENGWTVPGKVFQIENNLGCHLICLEKAPDGNMILKRQAENEFVLIDKVSAVFTSTGDIADKTTDLNLVMDIDKCVWVYCGNGILLF